MANYIIIGGDQKEYGPVSEADIRQWIVEGRLDAQSLAKVEGDAEFRPLGKFPDLADALRAKPPLNALPPIAASGGGTPADAVVLQQVQSPAVALKVISILNFLLSLWSLVRLIFFRSAIEAEFARYPQLQDPAIQKLVHIIYGPLGIGSNLFAMTMAAIIFFGATQMQKLKSYEFALVAAILAMVPCVTACCLLGLPFGIWALVVLNKPAVKAQFK